MVLCETACSNIHNEPYTWPTGSRGFKYPPECIIGCAAAPAVLMTTSIINVKKQIVTSYRINIPQLTGKKFVIGDYISDPTPVLNFCAKPSIIIITIIIII